MQGFTGSNSFELTSSALSLPPSASSHFLCPAAKGKESQPGEVARTGRKVTPGPLLLIVELPEAHGRRRRLTTTSTNPGWAGLVTEVAKAAEPGHRSV
ncbi:hypothetical protein IFR05_006876 [Cadophora sp. M221]|nr:hypothetical protein IFR05_006876 [Cadophora sp. M221]